MVHMVLPYYCGPQDHPNQYFYILQYTYTHLMKTYIITILLLLSCLSEGSGQETITVNFDSVIASKGIYGFYSTHDTLIFYFPYPPLRQVNSTTISSYNIKSPIILESATINDKFYLYHNILNEKIKLNLCTLNQDALIDFTSNRFNKDVVIDNAKGIGGSLNMSNDTFKADLRIKSSEINTVDIQNCVIDSTLIIRNSNIQSSLSLKETNIKWILQIENVKFSDSASLSFYNTQLPKNIYFRNITSTQKEIDLTIANFEDSTHYSKNGKYIRHSIGFYKTDISQIHFDYIHFRLALFDGKQYKETSFDQSRALYEAVLKNFKDRGQMLSYQLCDIEYRDFLWQRKWYYEWEVIDKVQGNYIFLGGKYISLTEWMSYIPKLWNNYGYNKGRVFGWALAFLCLFTVLTYFFFLDTLNEYVYRIKSVPLNNQRKSWWYSFVYTASVFFLISLKVENIKFEKRWHVVYLMAMYIVGIICLAYIANYIITR